MRLWALLVLASIGLGPLPTSIGNDDGLYATRFKEVTRQLGVFAREVDASRRSIEQDN